MNDIPKFEINCCICGTRYDANIDDCCPHCNWMFGGEDFESTDDEFSSANLMTRRKAKKNLAKGFNIWGKPLRIANNN